MRLPTYAGTPVEYLPRGEALVPRAPSACRQRQTAVERMTTLLHLHGID